jgi:hypothetical protein
MVIPHIDPDDGDREDLQNIGFDSTLMWLIAQEHFGTVCITVINSIVPCFEQVKNKFPGNGHCNQENSLQDTLF